LPQTKSRAKAEYQVDFDIVMYIIPSIIHFHKLSTKHEESI